ncbi:MAG: hypothetical protein ABWZ98_00870 [Nakamurella sp.]
MDNTAEPLATGFGTGGEHWVLTAQPDRGRLRVMAQVTESDGRRWTSGSGGRPLPPGQRIATFVGRSGPSAHLVIVRVAPDVRAVVATLSDGTREDLRLHGDPDRLGVRIAVLVYPAQLDLHRLVLLDQSGKELPDAVGRAG